MKRYYNFTFQENTLARWREPRWDGSGSSVAGVLCLAALIGACAMAVLAWKRPDRRDRWPAALCAAALGSFALLQALEAAVAPAPGSPIKLLTALAGLGIAVSFVLVVRRVLAAPTQNQVRALGEAKDRALGDLSVKETQLDRLIQLEAKVKEQTQELHESEARIMGFIRHASTAIAFKDLEARFVLINPRYAALLGRPEAEILGRTLDELIPPEVCGPWLERERRVVELREEIQHEESWYPTDQPARCLLAQKFPLIDVNSQCWGVGVIITDITEAKAAERAHLQDQKLESLGILAGGLAHDFNNLLGAMEGNVELAKLVAPSDGLVHTYLQTLEGLINRSSSLVQQILAYAGRGRTVVTALDLNHQVEELTRLLRASLSRKAVLRLVTEPGLPPIKGDPAQIQQVIMNLVLNASEAVDLASGIITIRTGQDTLDAAAIHAGFRGQALEPGPHVFLEVADNGPGMVPEVLERIFDPFFTTKFTGRGLGLSAVLGTLKAHHGGIRVHSSPGEGTSFRLLFPAAPGEVVPEATVHHDFEEAIGDYRGSGTVLVVDDEPPIRATAVQALRHLGFDTLEARDGLEALQVFEANRERIRLILMDLTMPRMNGEDAYRTLRAHGMLIPVLLTSGFCEGDVLEYFHGKGIAGFLQKPYRLHLLAQAVRKALDPAQGEEPRKPLVAPPDLDMGYALLDQQHRRTIDAFNQLAGTLTPGSERKEQEKALANLTEVTLTHFGVEETLMERLGYPRTREHQASHVRLIHQINAVAERVRQRTLTFSPALLDFLESWLMHHTQDEDRRLAQFLKGQGH
ncbi:MAG: bacteriohemerythrin [Holophaga sp.]|nr:bacteriohemerythrin [Holophaga sp.]